MKDLHSAHPAPTPTDNDMATQRLIPGLIGQSARTNAVYYLAMHEEGDRLLGVPVSFRSVMVSPDFSAMITALKRFGTEAVEKLLVVSAREAIAAGAGFIVVTSNTGSTFADALAQQCGVPVLGIVDPVIQAAKAGGYRKLGLISTLHTAHSGMYGDAGRAKDIEFFNPPPAMGEMVNELIVTDIALGRPSLAARNQIRGVIDHFRDAGADAVAFACTDLVLLDLQPGETALPVFDSTVLHARAAAAVAVQGWP